MQCVKKVTPNFYNNIFKYKKKDRHLSDVCQNINNVCKNYELADKAIGTQLKARGLSLSDSC